MNITDTSDNSDLFVTNRNKNTNTRANNKISYEHIYWIFFAGFGLFIGCFFVLLKYFFN